MWYHNADKLLKGIRIALAIAFFGALYERNWPLAFVSLATAATTMLPRIFAERLKIRLPLEFYIAIVVFIFATILLGEMLDFYERYWWWDLTLHFASAIGFGVIGFLLALVMFEGDRYAAPPIAIAAISYGFAVVIGTGWEIFEFTMDRTFGMNMQRAETGVQDTMWDLIVNQAGAAIAAISGWLYLKGLQLGGVSAMIDTVVHMNRHWFRKWK